MGSGGPKVVLVADVPEIQMLVKRFLEPEGYRVLQVPAVAVRQSLAGDEICALITNSPRPYLDSGVPILYISGAPDDEVVLLCKSRGWVTLSKPFTREELVAAVTTMCG